MTFVSVAQATTRLGIDAKTLHRWLAEAQLPLHRHPRDGRKKGLSEEHLQVLARRHQRRLTSLCEEPSALTSSSQEPPLPAVMLGLPEQLAALHTQLAALQHQVADLSRLLQQQKPEPVLPVAKARPSRTASRPPKLAPSAVTKPPRKPAHVTPRVEYVSEGHYVVICPKQGLRAFEPDSPAWFAWLAEQSSFRFVGKGGSFSAHHEWRVKRGAWRAHRHIRNRGYHLRLAPTQELTMAILEQVAEALQAHLR